MINLEYLHMYISKCRYIINPKRPMSHLQCMFRRGGAGYDPSSRSFAMSNKKDESRVPSSAFW